MDSRDSHSSFISNLFSKLEAEKSSNPLILQVSVANNVNFELPCVNAKEIIPKIIEKIKTAEKEVLICGYKIDRDCDGEQELIHALQDLSEKAKKTGQHIRVRILINRREGIAAYFRPNAQESKLRDMVSDNLDYQYVEHTHGSFGSYHTKQYLIDDQVAIICSGDMTKLNNYKNEYIGYTEVATIIHSHDFIDTIRKDFVTAWNSDQCNPITHHNKKKTIPYDYASSITHDERDDSMEELGYLHKNESASRPEFITTDHINKEPVPAVYFSKAASADLTRRSCSPYKIAVIEAIKAATYQIDIMTPNLNDPDVINELVNAITRGVHIRIVIGKNMNDDGESKPYMGGSNYENLSLLLDKIPISMSTDLRRNIQIHFATMNGKIIPEKDPNSLHAKFICIDEAIVIVGSSVLDLQSIYHSREGDLCFQSPSVAKQYLTHLFNPVFNSGIDYDTDKILTTNEVYSEKSNYSLKTAEIFFEEKNYESAMRNLIAALKIYPMNQDAYLKLQALLLDQNLAILYQISKSTLYSGIKQLAQDDQIRLLSECVNENTRTPLSRRMWQQEGLFPCSINASTLSKMNKRLGKLVKSKQSTDNILATQTRYIPRDNLFRHTLEPTSSIKSGTSPEISEHKKIKK